MLGYCKTHTSLVLISNSLLPIVTLINMAVMLSTVWYIFLLCVDERLTSSS